MQDSPRHYRVFDRSLASDMVLSALVPRQQPVDTDLSFRSCSEKHEQDFRVIHEWKTEAGELTIRVSREDGSGDFCLFFPDCGCYFISADQSRIECAPVAQATPATIEHLLLDQVIPRVMAQAGNLVLHGSCVQLPSGQVIAFIGETGLGKSTLAARLLESGARLLTDDSLLIRLNGEVPQVTPAYAGLRLWPDCASRFFTEDSLHEMAHYSEKKRVSLTACNGTEQSGVLDVLFVLELADVPAVSRIESSADLVMSLVSTAFGLDIRQPSRNRQLLAEIDSLLQSELAVRRLAVPHDFAGLEEVVRLVTDAATSKGV